MTKAIVLSHFGVVHSVMRGPYTCILLSCSAKIKNLEHGDSDFYYEGRLGYLV